MRIACWIALVAALTLLSAADGRSSPQRVTVIGDSVAEVLAQNPGPEQMLAQGFDLQLQTQACRKLVDPGCYSGSPPSALDVVQSLGSQLGPIVVVDVGYNDIAPTYQAGLDEVMTALVGAGVQHVVWVTLDEAQQAWSEIDQVIRAAPARWPAADGRRLGAGLRRAALVQRPRPPQLRRRGRARDLSPPLPARSVRRGVRASAAGVLRARPDRQRLRPGQRCQGDLVPAGARCGA